MIVKIQEFFIVSFIIFNKLIFLCGRIGLKVNADLIFF